MNRDQVLKMTGKQITFHPKVKRFKSTGEELWPVDYVWRIESTSKDAVTLFNGSTGHLFKLGLDHIREYLTDQAPGSDGFFVLKSQIILKGEMVYVEPL